MASSPPPPRWTPELALGDAALDGAHQELFRRAEQLIHALRENDRSEVEPLIEYLGDYVLQQFPAEERLMREVGYPGRDAHRAEHERFKNAFGAVAADLHESGPTVLVAMTLHNWISGWLREHVGGTDAKLAAWMRANRKRGGDVR